MHLAAKIAIGVGAGIVPGAALAYAGNRSREAEVRHGASAPNRDTRYASLVQGRDNNDLGHTIGFGVIGALAGTAVVLFGTLSPSAAGRTRSIVAGAALLGAGIGAALEATIDSSLQARGHVITPESFATEVVAAGDRNGDGTLDVDPELLPHERETPPLRKDILTRLFESPDVLSHQGRFVARADTDDDHVITRAELEAVAAGYDRDGDGALGGGELDAVVSYLSLDHWRQTKYNEFELDRIPNDLES